jgi:hypothetical protein
MYGSDAHTVSLAEPADDPARETNTHWDNASREKEPLAEYTKQTCNTTVPRDLLEKQQFPADPLTYS